MTAWLLAAVAGLLAGGLQYGARTTGMRSLLLALLRAAAVTILAALVLDAPIGRARALAPFAAVDNSASWARGGDSALWAEARRRAAAAGADSVFLFGDSVRAAPSAETIRPPSDLASAVRPVVDRALAAGRPLAIVTDGEIDDPDALAALPAGSRVEVVARQPRPDAALLSLDAPRTALGGDTVEVRVGAVAGPAGARAGTLTLQLGGEVLARAPFDSLPAYGERTVSLRARVPARAEPAVLRAALATAGDAEPRNDSVAVAIEVAATAGAVFVSTTPDYDARFALGVLRGSLAIPTRGFLRVAPREWRVDGTLAPVPESEVRAAVRAAPLVILHGDSLAFGPPAQLTRGTVALLVPPGDRSAEWYPTGAPPSPIAPALSTVRWDSLPPIEVGTALPSGEWEGLETRRARRFERRVPIVGTERPRRRVTVAASGFWRWQFRPGEGADAYAALWGSIFDWLAAGRGDPRAAVPAEGVVRAGERVRWRRGIGGDTSAVAVVVPRNGPPREDSVTLRWPQGATVAESAPLAPGVYDVRVRGGSALLVVNPSREWIPRAPTVRAGVVGSRPLAAAAPSLRRSAWPFVAIVLLLCAEWLLRRRAGLR